MQRTIASVRRDRVAVFAAAVGEADPIHHDLAAAQAAGHRDLVAPPMYVAVYAGTAFRRALRDAMAHANLDRVVHAAQELSWFALVLAGDAIETCAAVEGPPRTARGHTLVEVRTSSPNQDGELAGTWTALIRGR